MDQIVNNIRLTQNLIFVLKTLRTVNSTVKFSEYIVIFIYFLVEIVATLITKLCPFYVLPF